MDQVSKTKRTISFVRRIYGFLSSLILAIIFIWPNARALILEYRIVLYLILSLIIIPVILSLILLVYKKYTGIKRVALVFIIILVSGFLSINGIQLFEARVAYKKAMDEIDKKRCELDSDDCFKVR